MLGVLFSGMRRGVQYMKRTEEEICRISQNGLRLTNELSDEKTQSDAHRRDKIPLVLFRRQHENGKDKLSRQNHLYNDTLGDCRPASKRG